MFELPYIMLLAPFTLWWYALLAVCIPLAFWAMDDEDKVGGMIFLTTVFCVANVAFGTGMAVVDWVLNNPLLMLGGAAGYLAAGIGWCVFRWYSLVRRARNLYIKLAKEYDDAPPLRKDTKKDWITSRWTFHSRRYSSEDSFRPTCADYKSRITNWVAFWPLSVIWTGIREWVVDFFNMIYDAISGLLERISVSTWDGVDE